MCLRKGICEISSRTYPTETSHLIMQLLLDCEIQISEKDTLIYFIIDEPAKDLRLDNLQKFGNYVQSSIYPALFSKILKRSPNLNNFHGLIPHQICLDIFTTENFPLVHLNLHIYDKTLNEDVLSKLFFRSSKLSTVQEKFVKIKAPFVSFPRLRTFGLPFIQYKHYDFFKMLLHFYPNLEYVLATHYFLIPPDSPVSWFDSVLHHTVMLNPSILFKACELCINDLLLDHCLETVSVWKKLKSITLSIKYPCNISKKIVKPASEKMNLMSKSFKSILKAADKLDELVLRFFTHLKEAEVIELLSEALETSGHKIQTLKIVIHGDGSLGYASIIRIVKFCPNVQQLNIICRAFAEYNPDVKLDTLSKLTVFKCGWIQRSFLQYRPKSQVMISLVQEVLNKAPNLVEFKCVVDQDLTEALLRFPFGENLTYLSLNYVSFLDNSKWLAIKDKLPSFPKLQHLHIASNDNDNLNVLNASTVHDKIRNSSLHISITRMINMETELFT